MSRRLLILWAVMAGITLLSFSSSLHEGYFGIRAQAAIVVVLAFIKARIVILDFMEVRAAPWPLRLVLEAWCVIVPGAIIGMAVF
jgi:hypothetical protein